jgi:hypothetical protein
MNSTCEPEINSCYVDSTPLSTLLTVHGTATMAGLLSSMTVTFEAQAIDPEMVALSLGSIMPITVTK